MFGRLFFLAVAFALSAGEPCDVLFYVQDAGETNGLMPVAEELSKAGYAVQVLAGGTAQNLLAKSKEPFLPIALPIDSGWARDRLAEVDAIAQIAEDFEPKIFVSGVAFALQSQLYEAFRAKGVPTIAFWDNFNPDGTDPYFKTAHSVEQKADWLWVPSSFVAESDFFASRNNVFVSGHPSLEKWIEQASAVDTEAVRRRFSIEPGRKLAVFIGGYGADYEAAFQLLIDSLETVSPTDLFVLVQPHPKYEGRAERKILTDRMSNRALPLLLLQGEVSTIEAVAASDLVLCHQSTVGFQALFLHKSVIHLIPPGQTFSSLSLEKGWAKRASDPKTFAQFLSEGAPNDVPELEKSRCAEHLIELLERLNSQSVPLKRRTG